MKKKKVLCIGVGGWGHGWVKTIHGHSQTELVGGVDISPAALKQVKEEGLLPANALYENYQEALDKCRPELVILSAPAMVRLPIIQSCLNADIPLIIDKPLLHEPIQLKKLMKMTHKKEHRISIAQNYRWWSGARGLQKVCQSQKYGNLDHLNVFFARNSDQSKTFRNIMPQGYLIEMGVHHMDLLRFITGQDPVRIHAGTWAKKMPYNFVKGDSQVHVLLEFPNGVHATYFGSWAYPVDLTGWGGSWEASFDKAALRWKGGNPYPLQAKTKYHDWKSIPPVPHESFGVREYFNAVLKAFRDNTELPCSLQDNIHTMLLCFAVAESAKTGKPIQFAEYQKKFLSTRKD